MRKSIHWLFGTTVTFCVGAEVTGEVPYFPYSWVELAVALAVGWLIATAIMHGRSVFAVWNGRILPVFSPSARFRLLVPMIDAVRRAVGGDNPNPETIAALRMSPATTSEVKRLMIRLEELNIPYPEGRRIDRWIDWLPLLQSLAEDGKLRKAKVLDPNEKHWTEAKSLRIVMVLTIRQGEKMRDGRARLLDSLRVLVQ